MSEKRTYEPVVCEVVGPVHCDDTVYCLEIVKHRCEVNQWSEEAELMTEVIELLKKQEETIIILNEKIRNLTDQIRTICGKEAYRTGNAGQCDSE